MGKVGSRGGEEKAWEDPSTGSSGKKKFKRQASRGFRDSNRTLGGDEILQTFEAGNLRRDGRPLS